MITEPTLSYRSAASDATIRFGSAVASGRLISATQEKQGPKVSFITPDGGRVKRAYVDDDGNVYQESDLGRAIIEKGGVCIPIDAETYKATKESELPPNDLEFTAYSLKETAGRVVSEGKLYVFDTAKKDSKGRPVKKTPANEQWCDFIYSIVEKGDVMLLAMGNVSRNSESCYRLVIHQGNLALEKVAFQHDLRGFEPREVEFNKTTKGKAVAAAKAAVKPFEPEVFKNMEIERLEQLKNGEFVMDRAVEVTDKMNILDAIKEFQA